MQRREKIVLKKICSEIEIISDFLQGINLEEFLADEKTKRAVGMTAINIGELAKNLSQEFRQNFPEIEWRKAEGFRDIVAHKYSHKKY